MGRGASCTAAREARARCHRRPTCSSAPDRAWSHHGPGSTPGPGWRCVPYGSRPRAPPLQSHEETSPARCAPLHRGPGRIACPRQPRTDRRPTSRGAASQRTLSERPGAGRLLHPRAESLADHDASPAHPLGGRLWVITKLLRHPLGAAGAAERADGSGDSLPDLTGTWFLGALQRRHEQGVGTYGADAEVMHQWPHREPPRRANTSTTPQEYDTPPLMHANGKDRAATNNSSLV